MFIMFTVLFQHISTLTFLKKHLRKSVIIFEGIWMQAKVVQSKVLIR